MPSFEPPNTNLDEEKSRFEVARMLPQASKSLALQILQWRYEGRSWRVILACMETTLVQSLLSKKA